MQYIFNYAVTVALATPDGNLSRTRFPCGAVIDAITCTVNTSSGIPLLDIELSEGDILVNVPPYAISEVGYAVPAR